MAVANDALRFLLELAGIAGAAYWGWHTGTGALRILLAIVAPLVLIAVWALVVAPKADNPLDPTTRQLVGSALLLAVAAGAWSTGLGWPAAVFAGLVIVNQVLMLLLGS